jgi:hypothetical protein
MMRRLKLLAWSAVLVAVGTVIPPPPVAAATPPPGMPRMAWPGIALQAKPSTGLWMGYLHVVLEQTTLFEVQKAVADGAISSHGDAGTGISWLCYTNAWSPTPERIWISTHNEMGGPERRVMGVTAQVLPAGVATTDCPALPRALTPVRIDNGLSLNDRVEAVSMTLHTAVDPGREWEQFGYSGKVPGSGRCGAEGFDLLNGLAVRIRARRVVFLQINQVTSC